jgi:hypothetical protein
MEDGEPKSEKIDQNVDKSNGSDGQQNANHCEGAGQNDPELDDLLDGMRSLVYMLYFAMKIASDLAPANMY